MRLAFFITLLALFAVACGDAEKSDSGDNGEKASQDSTSNDNVADKVADNTPDTDTNDGDGEGDATPPLGGMLPPLTVRLDISGMT